jgi:hypothetical protein
MIIKTAVDARLSHKQRNYDKTSILTFVMNRELELHSEVPSQ